MDKNIVSPFFDSQCIRRMRNAGIRGGGVKRHWGLGLSTNAVFSVFGGYLLKNYRQDI